MGKNKKLGFIGCGKMANAIISGCLASREFETDKIFASEINETARNTAKEKLGIKIYDNNIDVVKNADVIVFCVKPFVIKDVLKEVAPFITEEKLVISIAAGIKIETIKSFLPKAKIIRVMPNTPAMVKEGISAICPDSSLDEEAKLTAAAIMNSVGETVFTQEKYIDAITALSGSGPAYYYKIIEDMAKSAEKLGLDYEIALKLSAQTAIGSGKMILQSGIDPQTLIKNVTTPGGCTEAGNKVLDKSDITKILDDTIFETAKKAKELG
ncbi:pyrroline-5-carboxylate reductase [bacterium]|nr:pyrroline-5-carboxylate reductase [bacterium]